MRKSKLKELHTRATAFEEINDTFVDHLLERLHEDHLEDEERIEIAKLLHQGIRNRKSLQIVKDAYNKRKNEDRGYLVGVGSSLLGVCIAEVLPKMVQILKKK